VKQGCSEYGTQPTVAKHALIACHSDDVVIGRKNKEAILAVSASVSNQLGISGLLMGSPY
jgi:hypothetical protein